MKQNNYLWIISTYIFALPYSRQLYLKCTFLTLLSHTGQTDLTTVIMREIKQYLSCGAQSCLNTDSREFIKI